MLPASRRHGEQYYYDNSTLFGTVRYVRPNCYVAFTWNAVSQMHTDIPDVLGTSRGLTDSL